MAEQLPINFNIPAENVIATYDYTDIVSGAGYATYYGCAFEKSTGAEKVLVAKKLTSTYGSTSGYFIDAGTTNLDLTPFNTPRTAKGEAYFSFYYDKNTTDISTVSLKLQKVSGGVATDIMTAVVTPNKTSSATNRQVLMRASLTETNFKVGDILRLVVVNTSAGGYLYIYLNPNGSYPFEINVPFKIET